MDAIQQALAAIMAWVISVSGGAAISATQNDDGSLLLEVESSASVSVDAGTGSSVSSEDNSSGEESSSEESSSEASSSEQSSSEDEDESDENETDEDESDEDAEEENDEDESLGLGTEKITVCHKGKQELTIAAPAVDAHIAHGDTVGSCDEDEGDEDEDEEADEQ